MLLTCVFADLYVCVCCSCAPGVLSAEAVAPTPLARRTRQHGARTFAYALSAPEARGTVSYVINYNKGSPTYYVALI